MHLHKRRNVLVHLCYRHTVYVCVGVYVASIDEVAALTWFTLIFSSIHEFVISLFYNAVTTQVRFQVTIDCHLKSLQNISTLKYGYVFGKHKPL